jgi:hypothetical protein
VSNSDFCHDGDGDGLHDLLDHTGVGLIVSLALSTQQSAYHSCDTTIASDVGGDSLYEISQMQRSARLTHQEP